MTSLKLSEHNAVDGCGTAYRYFDSMNGTKEIPELKSFTIIGRTPKGFRIEDSRHPGGVRQVFNTSCTQYAHEDKLHALESYRNRKIKHRLILEKQLNRNALHFQCIEGMMRKLERELSCN